MERSLQYVVAACQFEPVFLDPVTNRERLCARVEDAVREQKDTKLLVFGETATIGLSGMPQTLDERSRLEVYYETAESVPGPTSIALGRSAREYDVYIATGFVEADPVLRGVIYNSSLLIGPNGDVVAVHRKVQSGGMFKPGSSVQVHETAVGKLGLSICYDQLFPEFLRVQALQGCEVHVNMTANQPLRELSSTMVPIVRAYENTFFVVSANLIADHRPLGGLQYIGASSIINPFGQVLAQAQQEREETIFAEIDLREIVRARAIICPLKDIRTDLYHVQYYGNKESHPHLAG